MSDTPSQHPSRTNTPRITEENNTAFETQNTSQPNQELPTYPRFNPSFEENRQSHPQPGPQADFTVPLSLTVPSSQQTVTFALTVPSDPSSTRQSASLTSEGSAVEFTYPPRSQLRSSTSQPLARIARTSTQTTRPRSQSQSDAPLVSASMSSASSSPGNTTTAPSQPSSGSNPSYHLPYAPFPYQMPDNSSNNQGGSGK